MPRAVREVDQRPGVLRQAGAAEGAAWTEVGARAVELAVLAEEAHQLDAVDAQRGAELADLVAEDGLHRVIGVAHHLEQLGQTVLDITNALGEGEQVADEARSRSVAGCGPPTTTKGGSSKSAMAQPSRRNSGTASTRMPLSSPTSRREARSMAGMMTSSMVPGGTVLLMRMV
jgi:hypothetical protein